MSPWEMAAVAFAITYLLLAVRENVWCWLFAFVSTAIYTILFRDVSLLMDSALNVYYMAMAVFGWYQWTRGGTSISAGSNEESHTLAIQLLSKRQHGLIIVSILLFSGVSGYLLSKYSTAAWPYVDSFTTWASVIATYLITRKYLQNWLYWIVIDAVSVPLYIERGLKLTALLFAAYIIIAVVGYISWQRHFRDNRQVVEA
ncbi:MAG: nicotinamide riboside transporter PnuC [Gammaproteobacteria bacterium]|nr:MAG: nicotinamide riboside transporter PnuC [Gammaproteobacteria bacterium]